MATQLWVVLALLTARVPIFAQVEQTAPVVAPLPSAPELAARLLDERLAWPERATLEAALHQLPDEPVMLALVNMVLKPFPLGGIANGFGNGAQDEKHLSPPWRVFYSVHRVWKSKRPTRAVSLALIDHLEDGEMRYQALSLLGATDFWIPEARRATEKLLCEGSLPEKSLAVETLLRRVGPTYWPDAKKLLAQYVVAAPLDEIARESFLRRLLQIKRSHDFSVPAVAPTHGASVDADLVRAGFALLPALEKAQSGGGYFLALELGEVVQENFKAEQSATIYQTPHGLSEAFFAQVTQNALAWWQKSGRARFEN